MGPPNWSTKWFTKRSTRRPAKWPTKWSTKKNNSQNKNPNKKPKVKKQTSHTNIYVTQNRWFCVGGVAKTPVAGAPKNCFTKVFFWQFGARILPCVNVFFGNLGVLCGRVFWSIFCVDLGGFCDDLGSPWFDITWGAVLRRIRKKNNCS